MPWSGCPHRVVASPPISSRFDSSSPILTRHDRLLLGFDSIVLSEALGRDVKLGKIIHGDDFVTLRVNTSRRGYLLTAHRTF